MPSYSTLASNINDINTADALRDFYLDMIGYISESDYMIAVNYFLALMQDGGSETTMKRLFLYIDTSIFVPDHVRSDAYACFYEFVFQN